MRDWSVLCRHVYGKPIINRSSLCITSGLVGLFFFSARKTCIHSCLYMRIHTYIHGWFQVHLQPVVVHTIVYLLLGDVIRLVVCVQNTSNIYKAGSTPRRKEFYSGGGDCG